MSSLSGTKEELENSWRILAQCWEQTKTVWDDKARRDFETAYWSALEPLSLAAQRELANLAQVINQAQRNVK
ncbi:MAG: hypothetical protein HXX08_14915 [Chloroflexi bacterium]|uniref:Uncharacterized protein n=1 Tax=Candidatus Chlorohelix allophototropha TaxID=3003348 RepID=A0A8T7M4X7_9CHLR|nr:hypothetical protein [Chloroflexota bacterium]WJW69062.1 hypothetical protein OZ401_002655 [Chloroflexota bacterium L227-S17]